MNCSGHGNRPIQSRSRCCLPGRRRKTAARLLGVIQSASSLTGLVAAGINLRHLILLRSARIARTSFGRWPNVCAVAGWRDRRVHSTSDQVEARRLQLAAERGAAWGFSCAPTRRGSATITRLPRAGLSSPRRQRPSATMERGTSSRSRRTGRKSPSTGGGPETRALCISAPLADRPLRRRRPSYGVNRWS